MLKLLNHSEEQIFEFRHIDVALCLAIPYQLILSDKASHHSVGLAHLRSHLRHSCNRHRAIVVVVECAHFSDESSCTRRLMVIIKRLFKVLLRCVLLLQNRHRLLNNGLGRLTQHLVFVQRHVLHLANHLLRFLRFFVLNFSFRFRFLCFFRFLLRHQLLHLFQFLGFFLCS